MMTMSRVSMCLVVSIPLVISISMLGIQILVNMPISIGIMSTISTLAISIMPTISKVPGDIAGVVEGLFQTAKILVGVQK